MEHPFLWICPAAPFIFIVLRFWARVSWLFWCEIYLSGDTFVKNLFLLYVASRGEWHGMAKTMKNVSTFFWQFSCFIWFNTLYSWHDGLVGIKIAVVDEFTMMQMLMMISYGLEVPT